MKAKGANKKEQQNELTEDIYYFVDDVLHGFEVDEVNTLETVGLDYS